MNAILYIFRNYHITEGKNYAFLSFSPVFRVHLLSCEKILCDSYGSRKKTNLKQLILIIILFSSERDYSVLSLRVSWRFAQGIISSDDSLFDRWEAPYLDRVVLDRIREEDAGKANTK